MKLSAALKYLCFFPVYYFIILVTDTYSEASDSVIGRPLEAIMVGCRGNIFLKICNLKELPRIEWNQSFSVSYWLVLSSLGVITAVLSGSWNRFCKKKLKQEKKEIHSFFSNFSNFKKWLPKHK